MFLLFLATYIEENDNFCTRWKIGKCNHTEEARLFSKNGWKFTSALDIWGLPIRGHYATYGGGGYIQELNVNFDFSNRTLNELSDYLWIDKNTRAVFLEFTLYSPATNLHVYNLFLIETPETGGILTYYSIYPFRVYHHLGPTGIYTLFCEIAFAIFIFLNFCNIVYVISKQGRQFCESTLNVMDLLDIIMSVLCIGMYATRYIIAAKSMEKFHTDKKQFVNFYHIALWDTIYNTVLSTLVFISTLKFLGIFGYIKLIGRLIRIIKHCMKDLFWFGVLLIYIALCYATLGHLLFGKEVKSYGDIFDASSTLFLSILGKSMFTDIKETDPIMGKIYVFTFSLSVVFILLTICMSVLCESIDKIGVRDKQNKREDLIEFILQKMRNLFLNTTSSNKNKKAGIIT